MIISRQIHFFDGIHVTFSYFSYYKGENNKITYSMSLDLYITSKIPVRKRGTGVYVRENGRALELRTLNEVIDHFPDADISHIKEYVYETDEVWHENITHNMTEMADHVPIGELTLYDYLWRPKEHGFEVASVDYMKGVFEGLLYLKKHKEELLPYEPPINPETGERWGNYDLLVSFCASLVKCLKELDLSQEFEIESDV